MFLLCSLWHGVMFLYIYICLFACAGLPSLRVAIRSQLVSELWGIDDQALATKWSSSSSSTRLKTLSICWWRQVSSDPLCPIYFIIHCPAYYEQPKDLLAFYLPCPWFTFLVTMVSYMLALYFNQWTWWDTMMILWFYSRYDDILVAFRGLERFPEYLSVRTCSLRDHPG
jgi:hypothetical protein